MRTMASSIARYRQLEEELSHQRSSAAGAGERRGMVSRSWDGTLFAHVLVESTARKCLLRAVLLALALSADPESVRQRVGAARSSRSLQVVARSS